mgnify:CR=1 FL=1
MCDSGTHWIAYCWHSVEGYSKIGLYEGNGNADGTFIYTGFRPSMIITKNIDSGEAWNLHDTARSTINVAQHNLRPNSNAAEAVRTADSIDILSNGFKQRHTDGALNASNTYIYLAFAETPFKYSNAR